MTYSICALDAESGDLGVAAQSHAPAVGSAVPWVAPDVGAVATQADANVQFGPRALGLLRRGLDARSTLEAILSADTQPESRQVAIVDAHGNAAAHTGASTMAYAGHRTGPGVSVQANMMLNAGVPDAMASAFEGSRGPLATRLLAALRAAQAAGGDLRGMWSAVILVRSPDRAEVDPTWDLRVDDDPRPLDRLQRLIDLRLAERLERALIEQFRVAGPRSEFDEGRAEALAALAQIQALDQTDEGLFWFAVDLANATGDVTIAAELLTPLIARAPRWRIVLQRLPQPHRNDELLAAIPS